MKKNNNLYQAKRKKVVLFVAVLSLTTVILLDISPIGGNNIQYYTAWLRCGSKPYGTKGSGLLNAGAAHYFETNAYPEFRSSIEYFCTPLEAEKAGYSANPNSYEFPNLDKQKSQN